jgi:hypothetical protein
MELQFFNSNTVSNVGGKNVALVEGAVAIWTGVDGVPERIVWAGLRYRITDTPTPLEADNAPITHPMMEPIGWRFQGTTESGESRMFDVLFSEAREEWLLLHTYV